MCGVSNISVTDGYARGTPTSSRAKHMEKTPSLDEEGIIVLDRVSKKSADRMLEMVRHYKMIESLEFRKLELQKQQNESNVQLEQKREEREEELVAFETWKGKNAELDYKMNLLER